VNETMTGKSVEINIEVEGDHYSWSRMGKTFIVKEKNK